MITANRTYDFCYGHTVTGHHINGKPGKCRHIHGHNGRIEWTIQATELDELGRVLDFSVMKDLLDKWVEEHWDHKFLMWEKDPRAAKMTLMDPEGLILLDYNPTAENLANALLKDIGPHVLKKTKAKLVAVRFWETRKCFVDVKL